LDVSCGIGTQAIGLSKNGYHVTASDLSANEIERAKQEAQQCGQTNISFSVCDMRTAFTHHGGNFDIIISCDNSIPHLLTDDDILMALKQMYSCLRPGGGCLITIRNYDQEQRGGKNIVKPYGKAKIEKGKRYVALQVWDFDESDAQYYDFTLYIIEEDLNSKEIVTHAMCSRYYAISSEKLIKLMHDAGFENISRLNEGFYQPVYIGTRPTA
jgi:SAM-dependent methyltransferase